MSELRQRRLALIERQHARLERRILALSARSDRFATLRLLLAVAALPLWIGSYFVLGWVALTGALLALALLFLLLVRQHEQVQESIAAHRMQQWMKQTQLARMRLDWNLLPPAQFSGAAAHPFENDLNLPALHRLLNTAASQGGARRLYEWLQAPRPDPALIQQRQALVQELLPLLNLREALERVARLAGGQQEAEGARLQRWLALPLPDLRRSLWLLGGLSLLALLLLAGFVLLNWPPLWIAPWVAYVGLSVWQFRQNSGLFDAALRMADALRKLNAVLGLLEKRAYSAQPQLRALLAPILQERPSRELRRLGLIVGAASVQQNPYLWLVINLLVPWDVFWAQQLHREQARLRERLPQWLALWYELEALSAMASFAYLNPHYQFPQLSPQPAQFSARSLGHPLLPHEQRVSNDFTLAGIGEVLIITGSNMAGKSSFLRALGVNMVLAYAGGVVCAAHCELSLLRLFSCIQVTDSLQDGISYFYAEVRRLKALLAALRDEDEYPLFFLIDEIFRGTNNRERLIGSRAYIRALSAGRGLGLVATHDLELVKLAEDNPHIHNAHFREDIVAGRMAFDYLLRPGPSPTTNALKIMALEGLPTE